MKGIIVDLFAGGGGASTGIEAALGRSVDIAIDHSPVALAVHEANHPGTRHLTADIWEVKPKEATGGRHVGLLWASPDCTHFSVAKGGKPRKQNIRSLAWAVCRWAADVRPDVIALENVAEFKGWGPLDANGKPVKNRMGQTFLRWRKRLQNLGYVVDFRILDASHFGAPTRRRRLFLVARCDGQPIAWPSPTHGPGLKPFNTAASCIDWSLACPSIFERKKPLADKTLWRISEGIQRFVVDSPKPFLVQVGYGERSGQSARVMSIDKPLGTVVAGGQKHGLVVAFLAKHFGGVVGTSLDAPISTITAVDHHSLVKAFLISYYGQGVGQPVTEPLRTITTKDRLGLVTVMGAAYQIADIGFRMLEPHELLAAQFGRFAPAYDLSRAKTKAAKVRLIGNSVCPEVAEAIIRANFEVAEEMAA